MEKEQIRKVVLINYFYYFRYWKVGDLGSCYSDKVKENITQESCPGIVRIRKSSLSNTPNRFYKAPLYKLSITVQKK